MKLVIVQPWFSAIGHPAQSLINMACAIGKNEQVEYLVASGVKAGFFQDAIEKLRLWGNVKTYSVKTAVGDSNTVRALLALWRLRLKGCQYQRILFADESLFALALLWPFFSLWLPVERLSVLHLFGPRLGRRNWLEKFVIRRFLNRSEVRLYLRTEEIADAWRIVFNSLTKGKICYLPSLEIPDDEPRYPPRKHADTLAFGVIGQIRVGKGIEWLVPTFRNNTDLGKLTVAGEFASDQSRESLSVLNDFESFFNCFMAENEMLECAEKQDYLLMLYDQWDKRMESAVLYLAARVNRPVVVYGDGWCGRMVRDFGCGIAAPVDREQTIDLLRRLPRPGSTEYADLLKGMEAFRHAHSVKSLRGKVIQELLG